MSVGFVVDVGNSFELFIFYIIRYRFDKLLFVYLIRKLGYDNSLPRAVVKILDFALSAENNASSARSLSVSDAASAHDYSACREIGRGNVFQQLVDRNIGIIDNGDRTVNCFV